MSKSRISTESDPLRRSLRSLLQVGLLQGLLQLYNAFAAVPLTADQNAAIMVVGTPILAFAQNLLEDSGYIPSLLKAPASSGADPIPNPKS